MIDGRLLAPAAAAWLGAVVSTVLINAEPGLPVRHAHAVTVVAVTGAAVVLGVSAAWFARSRLARTPLLGMAAIGVAGLALGVGSAACHVIALTPSPLTEWVSARATAQVTAVIAGESVVRTTPNAPIWAAHSRQEVRIATAAVAARGGRMDVGLPMLLRVPEGLSIPDPGTTVEIVGRLSPARGPDEAATVSTDGDTAHLVAIGNPGPLDRWTHAMRVGLGAALDGVPVESASLVGGLAIGDDADQSASLRKDMRTSGLSHLTAVSGGNVAIVLVAVLAVATVVRVSILSRVLTALGSLVFFAVLVGPQPSVIRAAVMGGLVVVGMLAGGRRAGPAVLCTAILVLVVIAPSLTASWGFALSAGATAGLILVSPWIAERLARWRATARWPPALREALAVTTAAQVATLPLLLAMGVTVGVAALPANLLAMPVVAPVTVLGLLAAVISPLLPPAATLLAHLAAPFAAWIAFVAHASARLPGAVLPWPSGWWGAAALIPAVLAVLLLRWIIHRAFPDGMPGQLRAVTIVIATALAALWVVWPPSRRDWPPAGWRLIMCDVGQGDALLLRVAESQAVVVDAGPDPDRVDRCLIDAGIEAVPAIVLTHFHADHVGGLSGVLRGRDVASVLVTPVRDPPGEAAMVDQVLADEGLTATVVSAGDERSVGEVGWRAIWPRRVIRSGSVPNNVSVVLLARIGGLSAALLGDVEPEAQAALSPDLVGRRVDVVKVPHHGSRYQDPRLPSWIPAPIALVSVGAGNDYGHPAQSTIDAWRAIGAIVARTDEVGDVAVVERAGSGVGVVVRHGMLPSS